MLLWRHKWCYSCDIINITYNITIDILNNYHKNKKINIVKQSSTNDSWQASIRHKINISLGNNFIGQLCSKKLWFSIFKHYIFAHNFDDKTRMRMSNIQIQNHPTFANRSKQPRTVWFCSKTRQNAPGSLNCDTLNLTIQHSLAE